MSKSIKKYFLPFLLIFILSACNLQLEGISQEEGNDLLLTITAQAQLLEQGGVTFTPIVAQNQAIVYITATADGAASATPEAVVPAAVLPPAAGPVTVTVSVATNCRSGPGQSFANLYGMPVGQVAKVIAKNSYSGYWIIEIPGQNGQTCWLWGQYATVTGDTASLKDVVTPTSVATQTPTATVTPSATNTSSAVAGCTDRGAVNYNRDATADDGSCVYDVIITNTTVACEDQLDGTSKFTYTIDWIKNNNLSGLEYYFLYQWAWGDGSPITNREVVPISTSPIIGTDIKPTLRILIVNIRVVNPVTKLQTTTNPITLKCP